MNKEVTVIFDGSFSYDKGLIGVGVVYLDEMSEPSRIISHTIHPPSNIKRDDFLQKNGSVIAELCAAKMALDGLTTPSHVKIFGDCSQIVDTINNTGILYRKSELKSAIRCLRKSIGKHDAVKAFRVATLDADELPPAAIGIAHNASAIATNSTKIMPTPDYFGEYSHRSILSKGLPRDVYWQQVESGNMPRPAGLLQKRQRHFQPLNT